LIVSVLVIQYFNVNIVVPTMKPVISSATGVADPPENSSFRLEPEFQSRMRNNLFHRLSARCPFLYFDPEIMPPGKDWWDRKLGCVYALIAADRDVAKRILAPHILAVEFFPYISHSYGHVSLRGLQAQEYSFSLVRKAVKRGAVVIPYHGHRRWLKAVTELQDYRHLVRLKSTRMGWITKNNCCENDWAHIEEAIREIVGRPNHAGDPG
jgi:hypothetical protein